MGFRLLTLLLVATLLRSADAPPTGPIVCLGDSITAGYGLAPEQAWPALLQGLLPEGTTVVNAGVSGDTSAGGLRRVRWVLRAKPAIVIIALGGNDGLRALPVEQMEANLRAIVAAVRETGAKPMLAGMRMPANLGGDYATAFAAVYPRIAQELAVPLLPFLLDGVALDPALNQADQIHPNANGQRVIAQRMAAFVRDGK